MKYWGFKFYAVLTLLAVALAFVFYKANESIESRESARTACVEKGGVPIIEYRGVNVVCLDPKALK